MTTEDLVTDPTLTPLLQTAHHALKAALQLIDLASQYKSQPLPLQANLPAEGDAPAPSTGPPSEVETRKLLQAQKHLHSHLSILRGQNRAAILGVRATKADTAEARQEVDRLHLQLQNLLYEQRHLVGEIEGCERYDHAYAHLPLLPLEEYLELFPEHSALPEPELMPHRISHEKSEREKLEADRQELLKRKAELVAENGRRKDDLRKLDERMESFLEGGKSIWEVLEKECE